MKIKIQNDRVNGWYILRDEGKDNDVYNYLHKDGTWHYYCGKENFHDTYDEAQDLLNTLTEEERVRNAGDDPYTKHEYSTPDDHDDADYTATNEWPTPDDNDPSQEEIDEYLSDLLLDCEEERGADLELEFEGERTVTITIQIN